MKLNSIIVKKNFVLIVEIPYRRLIEYWHIDSTMIMTGKFPSLMPVREHGLVGESIVTLIVRKMQNELENGMKQKPKLLRGLLG